MAKKIRLDFSKVEERSGFNTKEIPEGVHEMKVVAVDVGAAKDKTDMLTYHLVPTDPRYKTRRFPYYCKIQENQMFKIRDLLVAAGIKVPKSVLNLDPEQPIGKLVAAEVSDESNPQYAGRSTIDGIYGTDILGDDAGSPADDDEDEVDEEAEEDEVEDDEEGDEEVDELLEELQGLTIVKLRARAKDLGIATKGVDQDDLIDLIYEEETAADEDSDDEDDLDDEELEDEDLEDEEFDDEEEEEEEPEPAPRRKAPARKAPAKAAPAAKRTVRRR